MVIQRIFKFYFVFLCCVVLSTFGLSYALLRRSIVRRRVVTFYSCESNLDRQGRFDQLKILNYDCYYVEELKLQIF